MIPQGPSKEKAARAGVSNGNKGFVLLALYDFCRSYLGRRSPFVSGSPTRFGRRAPTGSAAKQLTLVLIAFGLLLNLSGCFGFYGQAARGQSELLLKQRSLVSAANDPKTSRQTREKLRQVQRIRIFADRRLALQVGDNYGSYVDLKRDSVVWNVMAAPEFSLKPKTWCYPVAGCVGYRGFFAEADADHLVAQLQAQGYDVYSGGVDAYSTLGFLKDPVLNTFLDKSDVELASLLFHELAHARFYLKGDTAFNESFATAVEYAGLKLWLQEHDDSTTFDRYLQYEEAIDRFRALVAQTRGELAQLYRQPIAEADMRMRKQAIISTLRDRYQASKPSLNGVSFDKWFFSDINNAKLNSVATYEDLVPGFTTILARCNQDFPCFYAAVERLSKRPKAERDALLRNLGQASGEKSAL